MTGKKTMSRLWVWFALVVAVQALLTAGCSGLTRPAFNETWRYSNWSDDQPPNVADIVAKYPELKGLVLTAPEYNAELEQQAKARGQKPGEARPLTEYVIQPGVTINFEVIGEPEFTRTIIVNTDGTFDYPYLGRITARGLTLEQLKAFMKERLSRYLRDPQLVLNATSAPSQTTDNRIAAGKILVVGRINSGTYNYTGQETLAGMLALAGWFNDFSEPREVRVIKRRKDHRRARIIVSDFKALIVEGDMAQDVPVDIDDIIYVPGHWTAGQQFEKDWDLSLKYLQGAVSYDNLLQYWSGRVKQ